MNNIFKVGEIAILCNMDITLPIVGKYNGEEVIILESQKLRNVYHITSNNVRVEGKEVSYLIKALKDNFIMSANSFNLRKRPADYDGNTKIEWKDIENIYKPSKTVPYVKVYG